MGEQAETEKHRRELVNSLFLALSGYAFQPHGDDSTKKLRESFENFLKECETPCRLISNFKVGDKVTYNGGSGCSQVITRCTIYTVKGFLIRDGETHLELNVIGTQRFFPQKYFNLLQLPKEHFVGMDTVYYVADSGEGTIFNYDDKYQISNVELSDGLVFYISLIDKDGNLKGLGQVGKKVLEASFSHKPKVKPPVVTQPMDRTFLLNKGDFVRYVANRPETGFSQDEVLQVSLVNNLYENGCRDITRQNVCVLSSLPRVSAGAGRFPSEYPGEYESPWMDCKDFRRVTQDELVAHRVKCKETRQYVGMGDIVKFKQNSRNAQRFPVAYEVCGLNDFHWRVSLRLPNVKGPGTHLAGEFFQNELEALWRDPNPNKFGIELFKKGDKILYKGKEDGKLLPFRPYKVSEVIEDDDRQLVVLRDLKGHWAGKVCSERCTIWKCKELEQGN